MKTIKKVILYFPEVEALPQFVDIRFHLKSPSNSKLLLDGYWDNPDLEVSYPNPDDSSSYYKPLIAIEN